MHANSDDIIKIEQNWIENQIKKSFSIKMKFSNNNFCLPMRRAKIIKKPVCWSTNLDLVIASKKFLLTI